VTWLVTGGAGYIGSHVVAAMRAAGQDVVVLDDLSSGVPERVGDVPLVPADVADGETVARTVREHGVRGVVHLAAKKQVEESVRQPLRYYRENVEGLRALLETVTAAGVTQFVFSSSAAVYGAPDVDLVDEGTACLPVNPYGRTKLIGEQMLADVAPATGLRYAALRYFNVAGAAEPALADRGAANLVPLVFRQLSARRPPQVFGDDHDTPDGTCIRDFVHVADVASAHVAAAAALTEGRIEALTANIGRGEGVSVRELAALVGEVTGLPAEPLVEPRRPGDAARAVASAARMSDELGWTAGRGVREMVESAWEGWCLHHPEARRVARA
jgi:UDP-glucose 4-epimerase